MLKKMDKCECFDRADGIDPFLLLDGHGSRFELPFVEYIHGDDGWTVCIGVPYGKSLWQVGDSKQQNGQYKDKSKEGKERLLTMKTKRGLRFTIVKQDIMWIVRYAWEKSFARVETNKHAIAERGWGPLHYVLLDHPELKQIEDRVSMVTLRDDGDRYFPQESLNDLNTTEGIAGDTIELFMEEKARREELDGMDRAGRDRQWRETAQKKLDMGKRLTSGIWAAAGNHCIDMECMAIQDSAMDTMDNESAAENDESSDELVMCDSESSDDYDDSLDFFPKLSGADDEYCRPKWLLL
jgi:hypothetical protein